jgi:hypothetical protein
VCIFSIYYATYDMTWGSYPAWILLAIEAHVGVICASAPALEVYFKRWDSSANISSHEAEMRSKSVANAIEPSLGSARVSRSVDLQLRQNECESSEQLRRSSLCVIEEGYGRCVVEKGYDTRSETSGDIIELGHLAVDNQYKEPQFPHICLAADIFSRPSVEE